MNDMLITLEANATDIEEEPTLNQFITAIISEKRETDVFLLDISDTDDATVIERCRKAVRWLQAIESNTTAHGSETTLAILSRVRSRLGCL